MDQNKFLAYMSVSRRVFKRLQYQPISGSWTYPSHFLRRRFSQRLSTVWPFCPFSILTELSVFALEGADFCIAYLLFYIYRFPVDRLAFKLRLNSSPENTGANPHFSWRKFFADRGAGRETVVCYRNRTATKTLRKNLFTRRVNFLTWAEKHPVIHEQLILLLYQVLEAQAKKFMRNAG